MATGLPTNESYFKDIIQTNGVTTPNLNIPSAGFDASSFAGNQPMTRMLENGYTPDMNSIGYGSIGAAMSANGTPIDNSMFTANNLQGFQASTTASPALQSSFGTGDANQNSIIANRDAHTAVLDDMANPGFDWGGAANIGLSAFDSWNKYNYNKDAMSLAKEDQQLRKDEIARKNSARDSWSSFKS